MAELEGRVALVTGASRGIGAATARALAAAGAKVIVTDLAAPGDVAQEIGGLALLVNNAGVFSLGPITGVSLEEWRRVQAVNVEGVILGCKHAIPALAERAPRWAGGAAIVNLSSVAGLVGNAGASCYSASKGAVRLMTKCLALELAPARIRVNSVHPGVIDTHMGGEVVHGLAALGGVGDNEARARVDAMHPLGHMGRVADIAEAIAFLASDKAAFMTGSEMVVDGGLTAS